jgi:hypothetical protein
MPSNAQVLSLTTLHEIPQFDFPTPMLWCCRNSRHIRTSPVGKYTGCGPISRAAQWVENTKRTRTIGANIRRKNLTERYSHCCVQNIEATGRLRRKDPAAGRSDGGLARRWPYSVGERESIVCQTRRSGSFGMYHGQVIAGAYGMMPGFRGQGYRGAQRQSQIP